MAQPHCYGGPQWVTIHNLEGLEFGRCQLVGDNNSIGHQALEAWKLEPRPMIGAQVWMFG